METCSTLLLMKRSDYNTACIAFLNFIKIKTNEKILLQTKKIERIYTKISSFIVNRCDVDLCFLFYMKANFNFENKKFLKFLQK